jgi:phosphoribosylglycinamide formyltransferase-1
MDVLMSVVNLAILISGRGSNMNAILKAIKQQEIVNVDKIVVISNNKESFGLQIAKNQYNVDTELILNNNFTRDEFDNELYNILNLHNICPSNGLICLAGFMRILGPFFVNRYKHSILNIHPSLLPSFKGLYAQKQALDAGVKVSGCTVHFVDPIVDTGPIILQKCVPVYDTDSESILSQRILVEEHKLYKQSINLVINKKLRIEGNKVVRK